MGTTKTDRESRVERAIADFEERKRRFFRMDGSKVYGEAEHMERMEKLASELREEVREEIEGAPRVPGVRAVQHLGGTMHARRVVSVLCYVSAVSPTL